MKSEKVFENCKYWEETGGMDEGHDQNNGS
jgi:hypothetical protein